MASRGWPDTQTAAYTHSLEHGDGKDLWRECFEACYERAGLRTVEGAAEQGRQVAAGR